MARITIIYGSGHGQTRKIARRIAERAREKGHRVVLLDGNQDLSSEFVLVGADAVVIGASIRIGKHQKCITQFVKSHRDDLAQIPTAFVSVSMSAARPSPSAQAEARRYVARFEKDTGWRAGVTGIFGGALAYTKYDLPTRLMMWLLSRRNGGDTDTSRDYEYTNWAAVDRFTNGFLESVSDSNGRVKKGFVNSPAAVVLHATESPSAREPLSAAADRSQAAAGR